MANEMLDATGVANAMANFWKLRGVKHQFNRFADTLRWFRPAVTQMQGEKSYFFAFTSPYSGVRRTKTAQETEFPKSRAIDWAQVYYDWDDIAEFQASVTYSGLAKAKTRRQSVANTARDLVSGMEEDFEGQANAALHQNGDCVMALVAAAYDEDGTTYTSGQTDAFLQIDGGSISQFNQGDVLDIREGSDNADVQATVVVNDVYHTTIGPAGVEDIGPGITVTIATENAGDADLDAIADGDEIVRNGEVASNFDGFETWFDPTSAVLSLTRNGTKGEGWASPFRFPYASGGSNVTLDLDDHLRPVAEQLSYAIKSGRRSRRARGGGSGPAITGGLVCITTPKLNSEACAQVGDSQRFTTTTAMNLDAAKRQKLFGSVGFEGVVWHHPNLPPIAFQADPVATPNTIRILEPNSWKLIAAHEGGLSKPELLDKDGTFWHYKRGATYGSLINVLVGGGLMRLEPICDQPRANVALTGLKSSQD